MGGGGIDAERQAIQYDRLHAQQVPGLQREEGTGEPSVSAAMCRGRRCGTVGKRREVKTAAGLPASRRPVQGACMGESSEGVGWGAAALAAAAAFAGCKLASIKPRGRVQAGG